MPYAGEDSGPAPESASGLSGNDFPSYGKMGVASLFNSCEKQQSFLNPLIQLPFNALFT